MRTMINISKGTVDYPFQAISSEVIQLIEEVIGNLNINKREVIAPVKRTFECFLQITDQRLNESILRSPKFARICVEYYGALYDSELFDMKIGRKYDILRIFVELVDNLVLRFNAFPMPVLKISRVKITGDVDNCIMAFRKIQLNQEKLWIWRGWPCKTKSQKVTWPNLLPLFNRLGKEFTESIYQACNAYISSRNETRIPCLKPLVNFIALYPEPLKAEDFNRPEFMGRFWRKFLKYYIISEYDDGNGSKISTLTSRWRNNFKFFVETYLNQSDFFAEPWGEFPLPPVKNVIASNTNVTVNASGELIKTKLLTEIPLNITDEEALELLFKSIQADVDIATQWATWEVNDIWNRYQKRIENSSKGQVVSKGASIGVNNGNGWLTNRNNPDHLKHAARTLNERIHILSQEALLIMPRPILQTAYELGMPTTGAFLPHCILLIANHPSITSSFLENFELFDKHGRLTGFVESDGNYKLIGVKKRRGPRLAQQIVILNETTTSVVKQIIALSVNIREYLKANNDSNWRYLLLTCGQAFSYPVRVNKLASDTSSEVRILKIIESLKKTSDLSLENRINYVRRFSLSSLRASAAVLIYLRTQSIEEFSKALGHAEVDPCLIKRYLPQPILAFFQDRWIRIFQTAIIVEALKESEFLLEASGFKSIDELDIFFKEHALKIPPTNSEKLDEDCVLGADRKQILFGVNSVILTLMISLQQAVQQASRSVHAKAIYWAELTKYLVSYIEQNESHRPDLRSYLEEAKKLSNPLIMESLIYG